MSQNRVDIVLVGGGGHALTCIDLILESDGFSPVGYVAPDESEKMASLGLEFLGGDERLPKLSAHFRAFHVAIGQIKTAAIRMKVHDVLVSLGVDLPVIRATDASISPRASLGVGSLIGRNAVVNAAVLVGQSCIVNSGAILEHGAVVSDHCHIAPGAIVLGDAFIGPQSFIGAGAIIREGVKIASGSVVPAGACIMGDFGG